MSEIKLLRCPFCGGEAGLLKGQCEIDNYVMCLECRSKTKLYNTKASAIKAWNTRKPMDRIVEQLEECYERYEDLEYYEHLENGRSLDFEYCHGKKDGVNEAIEIVKEEGDLNE